MSTPFQIMTRMLFQSRVAVDAEYQPLEGGHYDLRAVPRSEDKEGLLALEGGAAVPGVSIDVMVEAVRRTPREGDRLRIPAIGASYRIKAWPRDVDRLVYKFSVDETA